MGEDEEGLTVLQKQSHTGSVASTVVEVLLKRHLGELARGMPGRISRRLG